ncbi:ankyrin repeat [Pyrenophora seminiperda CCB06]|uniref:Ankyrin repeat n=1 Tax=Pyrenophora seminiperda CCB06 TaxID=1302712 RepID=A0A3M7MCX8_9PLEO|nr:ankyrin repeat [Pyrenophora seminiperda CCB06]
MDGFEELLRWAVERGVEITGIKPQTIPSRGTGVIATREIQAGEAILVVPFKLFRSLKHVPRTISRKLPRNISLHALLAAYVTLDKTDSFAMPNKALPDLASFEASMPFLWPSELHSFLPKAALDLLKKQQRNFQRDWAMVSKAFPDTNRTQYLHSWMLVNTRSFYCTTPSMERLPHDDRLAILPVADLFNHADVGCEANFSPENYTFVADRDYHAGDEVCICYGTHSNDFMLTEYGFVPTENRWDVVCLDDAILPCLNEEQKDALKDRGFLGKYMLDIETGGCFRTQVALRLLCCTREEWEQFIAFEAGEEFADRARGLLVSILKQFVETVRGTVEQVEALDIRHVGQREMLVKRWGQIEVECILDYRHSKAIFIDNYRLAMMTSEKPIVSMIESSTDIGAIWSAAVERYEATTNKKVQSLDRPKSVDEILVDFQYKEKTFTNRRHDGSRLDKFRTLLRRGLAPIAMWGDIISNATKTTANAVSADFDRIEEFFDALSSYLTRLKVWEHGIPRIRELEQVITEVFMSVLVVTIFLKFSLQDNTTDKPVYAVKAFRALAGEDDELKSAFDQFSKTIQKEEGIVRNAVLAGVHDLKLETSAVHTGVEKNLELAERIDRKTDDIAAGTNEIHRYLETHETAVERNNILAWLSSLDFGKKQRDTHNRHCNGTGNWFLDAEMFKQWLNNTQNSTLWCSGIPGAGKSIMTSVAISHVEEHTDRRDVAIAYVYCSYTDSQLQSEIELISSLTRQLIEQTHPIPLEVKTYRDRWIEKRSYPTQEDRVSLIKDIALRFSKTYIFVDALDECPEQNRNAFLHMLRMLEPFTRLFITSRPHLELQTRFTNLSRIEITASHSDIQVYLESEISTSSRMSLLTAKDPTLKAEIIDTISRKSEGMFLVAHFQVALICRMSNPKKVRQSLNTLPTEIYDFYEEAFTRIESYPEEDRQLVKKAIAYIYCARRPLTLEELCHALSIEPGDTEFDEYAVPEMEIVLNISVGLIRVNEKSNIVALAHQTLQEYLAKNSSRLLHQPEAEIAKTCLTYLTMDVFESGPCLEGEALEQRLQEYLFLDYASQNWGYHLINNDLNEWKDLLLSLLSNEEKISHIPRYRVEGWYNRFPKDFSPLHVVAYWGLDFVLKMYPVDGVDVNSQDSDGKSALQLAARRGHLDVVRALVEDSAELDIRNSKGETALYWAVRSGHDAIAELLLAKGADPMIEDSEGWTALDWAVIGRYPELARLLLDRCRLLDPEYSGANSALILAAETGNEATVQMLLDLGAEIDWKDRLGSTALEWAVPEGHEKVVRLLLDNGADVNARDVSDNTPLHWSLPYPEITKLLLERGADINAKNNTEATALLWSAHGGQEKVLRLLLDSGADVTLQDHHGCTALHAAALEGHEAIASLLIGNGSDPNKKDNDGWTPLHAAALKQHDELVRMLLDKTNDGEQILIWIESQHKNARKWAMLAEIADQKSEGSTVVSGLGAAAQDGHFERVQALIETGVDINALDAGDSTPLILAVNQNQARIVRLLLEQGALVNKPQKNGPSALYLAAKYGYTGIIDILVEHGADVNGCFHTWTPLLIAAKNGPERIVEYLVKHGAKADAADYQGRTALHWASHHCDWKTLQLLVEYGADIHAKDYWSRTPLRCAVESMDLANAKFLLDIGADVETKALDASTPLHVACYLDDWDMVSLLLERGASTAARSQSGFRPLQLATAFGSEKLVQLLLKKGGDGGGDGDAKMQQLVSNDGDHDDDKDLPDGFTEEEGIDAGWDILGEYMAVDTLMRRHLQKKG